VRRRQLEGRIEELRAFEREYRTRLKAYLETQLRELGSGPGTTDESGAGVPADARAAAVAGGSFGRRPAEVAPEQAPRPELPTGPAQEAGSPAARPQQPVVGQQVGPFSVVRAVPDKGAGAPTDTDAPAER
jgi:hypothetical protein